MRSIQITDRDREIVSLVSHHRFLRTTHLAALVRGSAQQVSRRLQLLYHHGFLERPRAQLEYFHRGGSSHMVYGLGNKGAALLREELGNRFSERNWGEKNRSVGRIFLQHALLVSDVLIAIQLACRERKDVKYIGQHEVFPHEIRWQVTIERGRKLGVVPDAAFALEWTRTDGELERVHFFVEADRGTMPIVRRNLTQTSFRRKLLAYEATWSQNIHRSRFGINRFRMLTFGTSERRLSALRNEGASLKSGKGLFVFFHRRDISDSTLLIDALLSPRAERSALAETIPIPARLSSNRGNQSIAQAV
jgi:hypothetical protein